MVETLVFRTGAARFDMAGQCIGRTVHPTPQSISPGLAKRLLDYATERMGDAGLTTFTDEPVTVETCDGDSPPSERAYSVTWENIHGTEIGIQGILTRKGWPCVDHGFFIHT